MVERGSIMDSKFSWHDNIPDKILNDIEGVESCDTAEIPSPDMGK